MRKVDTAARLNNATISGRRSNWLVIFCLGLCAIAPAAVGAAGYEFLALESVYDKLPQDRQIGEQLS